MYKQHTGIKVLLLSIMACTSAITCAGSSGQVVHMLHSWKQAVEIFERHEPGTLVLLDVDHTLIIQDYCDAFALGKYAWPQWLHEHIVATYPVLADPNAWEQFYSVIWKQAPRFLTEPEVIDVINKAHDCGHVVLALTFIESGSYGIIDSMPQWRYEMLTDMGIKFSTMIPDMVLDKLPSHRDLHPVVHQGIICCNWCAKGTVLQELLRIVDYTPKHIIFIDDDPRNLHTVGQACAVLNIPCTLYHYNNPVFEKPAVDLHDFMYKVAYVLETGKYPVKAE